MPKTAIKEVKAAIIAPVESPLSIKIVPLKMQDTKEVQTRIEQYFMYCETNERLPTITGMCLSLNTSRASLYRYRKGGSGISRQVAETLNRAVQLIEECVESRMLSGKLNPSAAIYWLNNVKSAEWSDKREIGGDMNININVAGFGKKPIHKRSKNIN